MNIAAGDTFKVEYPFVLEDHHFFDEDGPISVKNWRPGVRYENADDFGTVDTKIDGKGVMHLAVVDVHKPGKFPTRVFYTRQWEGPDGKRFGKGNLHITTVQHFKRLVNGYRYWDTITL